MAMGLAVGAGYVLGRTKKAKVALGLTTLVLGRKLAPDGASVGSFLGSRLGDNPQVKEIRELLRTDLRGVGSAAVSAIVDRRLEAVADRLHHRTLDVQDRLAGLAGRDEKEPGDGGEDEAESGGGRPPARKRAAAGKKAAARTAGRRTGSSTAKNSARTAKSAGKPTARRPAKRTAAEGKGGAEDA
ncbi:DNA primase [Streptomyces subrutilus]|uniref:DNA primase n=1 Tax=Streptomyces subrutilus TaxID=36818 RepID=UPI00340001D4